jgi:hypothetical protein
MSAASIGIGVIVNALKEGVVVDWGPPVRFRGPSAQIRRLREEPLAGEFLRRAYVFRLQLGTWARDGRVSVPVLVLPDAPLARIGACVSCGLPIHSPETWRCLFCLAAVQLALGAPDVGAVAPSPPASPSPAAGAPPS